MALIRMDHVPETTKVNSPLYITLPNPSQMKGIPVRDRFVLYLLHGLSDDGSAWQRYTQIEVLAEQYGLVVVMPSVGRSMYLDQRNGLKYFTYITQELPAYLHDVFGISPQRERTLIAGNSMGGYGAMKAAFLNPGSYFAAASFSGVLSLQVLTAVPDDPRRPEFAHLFGDLSQVSGSEHDPEVWINQAASNSTKLPDIYVSTGRQEDIYPLSGLFAKQCQSHGIPVDYYEEDGRHDWVLWNRLIQRFLGQVLEPVRR